MPWRRGYGNFNSLLGGTLRLGFALPGAERLELAPAFSFLREPLQGESGKAISSLSLGAGLRWRFLNLGPLEAALFAGGGGFAATLSDSGWDFNPLAYGGLGLRLPDLPLSPGIEVALRSRLGLSTGLALSAGASIPLGGASAGGGEPGFAPTTLELVSLELEPVFPVFYKHYDDHPVGTLVVRNRGSSRIKGVEASLFARQFMDNPKAARGPDTIAPGAEARYELYGLFAESILAVSEGTKVSVNVELRHSSRGGKTASLPLTATLEVYDRNASTWDDDRRVAAFVTAKDPLVQKFAKNGVPALDEARRRRLPEGLAAAAAAFESMRLYGLRYAIDPASSYAALSEKTGALDFIQFPRQTLDFKAGDCDDLSILFCALLEALGVETAFVTVPGHIYVAVDLGMGEEEARRRLSKPEEAIFSGGRAWLPVEVTVLKADFLAAWELGAREWREAGAKGSAALYPVREAWRVYAPVGLASEKAEGAPPSAERLVTACASIFKRYAEREAQALADRVRAQIKKEGETAKLLNRLGVVYASYGIDDKAAAQFQAALAKQDYAPAAFNLGNLAFLAGDAKGALGYYLRAYKRNGQDPGAMLALSRTYRELGDAASSARYFAELKKADPALAARYAWLEDGGGDATRAGKAGERSVASWAE